MFKRENWSEKYIDKILARKYSDIKSSHLRPILHIEHLQEFSIFLTQILASAIMNAALLRKDLDKKCILKKGLRVIFTKFRTCNH